MSGLKVSLIYDDLLDMWRIRAPFNQKWIDDFKRLVPYQARRWNNDEKIWFVDPMFLDPTKELCDKYYDGWVEHRPNIAPQIVSEEASCYRAFVELLPPDILKRAYREAARVLHSDVGGEGTAMRDLNVAFDQIKTARGL